MGGNGAKIVVETEVETAAVTEVWMYEMMALWGWGGGWSVLHI